jgi:hypothetical protein
VQGSEVIVTTCSDRVVLVARTMSYCLMELPKEDCWSLFAKHAWNIAHFLIYFLFFVLISIFQLVCLSKFKFHWVIATEINH